MSIIATVRVNDGLVIGADSASSIWAQLPDGQTGIVQVFNNSRKIYQVSDYPIAVATYGAGNIGINSIRNLLLNRFKTYQDTVGQNVSNIAVDLAGFFGEMQNEAFGALDTPPPALGFIVAGFTKDHSTSEALHFLLPNESTPTPIQKEDNYGANWFGTPLPFTRVYKGIDPRITMALHELVGESNHDQVNEIIAKYESPVVYHGMPLSEAIRFVKFILHTTVNMSHFEAGPASCALPLTIAVIPSQKKLKWVSKIYLDSDIEDQ